MTDRLSIQTSTIQAVSKEWVTLSVQGEPMQAYLVQPEAPGHYPAVLVLMEIFGVNSHIQDVAERLAAQGYITLAPNYYHRTTQNLELGYTDRDVVIGRKHKEQTTRAHLIADLNASIAFLETLPKLSPSKNMGCIGFCFGGHVAFIAAEAPQIKAAIAFYPGGVATASPGGGRPTISHAPALQAEMLCLFGMNDPLIPPEDTDKIEESLKNAGKSYEVIRYENTGHGFFCDQRKDFDPSAAEDAWERVLALLGRRLQNNPN